ncbi:hypothetical protein ABB27_18640 [Stenotrophomonas terrae]|uniref:Uncharacterized protein n=1 Tax=Stenotrophomonas terrae TaxID=405446 RepID=A0A0R0BXW6_9GAMM|nr:hypothetical protein ABB27_18640 [Stenotrophomonas terrae]
MQESLVGEVGLVIMGVAARRRKSVSGQEAALGREVALICVAFAVAPSFWPQAKQRVGEGWLLALAGKALPSMARHYPPRSCSKPLSRLRERGWGEGSFGR